jgi:hypothetical protein
MREDPRCCGTGTCIINADGMCWCGQRWDGEKMCFPKMDASIAVNANVPTVEPAQDTTPSAVSLSVSAAHKA